MKKFRNFLTVILLIAMTVSCLIPLTSCSGGQDTGCTAHTDANSDGKCDTCGETVEKENNNNNNGNTDPTKATYTVSVSSIGGMKLSGVMCYIHNGDGYNIVARAETDENGIATFELDASGDYSVEIDEVTAGYNVKTGETKEDRYQFIQAAANIILTSSPISGNVGKTTYETGDIIHDFSFTTTTGETISISSLLEEKEMVMLNFWYTTCSWCIKEFPYMISAYEQYQDDVAIIAINDYATDTAAMVKEFTVADKDGNYVSLPFYTVKDNNSGIGNAFFDPQSRAYPASVIIDRYGMITVIELGAIINEKYFTNAFKHFVSDTYKQDTYESLSELTPVEKPDGIDMPSSEEISAVLDKDGKLNVTFTPELDEEDKEYSWPFIIDKKGEYDCIRPTNIDKDKSFATIYMNVELKAGEALVFDYFSSTHLGYDMLYVIVDNYYR